MEQDLHPQSEQAIIQRLRAGHEATFEAVFRKYYSTLCAYACKYVSGMEVAEEMVQNLFVKLWERRDSLEIKSALKAYLFNAIRNNCLSYLRHEKVKAEFQRYSKLRHAEENRDVVDEIQQTELEQLIAEAINALPAQCQRIFRMSRFEELKYREIAEALGLSQKTVEAQMGKALKRIREALERYER